MLSYPFTYIANETQQVWPFKANERYQVVLSFGAICFSTFGKRNFVFYILCTLGLLKEVNHHNFNGNKAVFTLLSLCIAPAFPTKLIYKPFSCISRVYTASRISMLLCKEKSVVPAISCFVLRHKINQNVEDLSGVYSTNVLFQNVSSLNALIA